MTAKVLFNPRSYTPSEKLLHFVQNNPALDSHYLFQSSGSTGTPKWVALSAEALEASARAVNEHLEVSSGDIFALALPDFHVGGFGLVERARVAKAKLLKFDAKWNAKDFASWMTKENVTVTSLVPAQIYDLIQNKIPAPKTLKSVVVGGGALPESLYFAARELSWPLLLSYGLTECASQVATSALDSLNIPAGEKLWPQARVLSHMQLEQVEPLRVSAKSLALLSFYLIENDEGVSLLDPKKNGAFLLPDKIELKESSLIVSGRWEQEYKVLGEWIRWDFLKKKFADLCVKKEKFLRYEIEIFPDDRSGNKLILLCESFDESARTLLSAFNAEVFPFERITHYYEANLPRSELGKILRLKINPICLKEISG